SNRLGHLTRKDGNKGTIKEESVYVSTNGENFTKVANGQWENTSDLKEATFSPQEASFVKLEAIEGHGGWASAAEIYIDKTSVISPGDQIPFELNVKKKNGESQNLKNIEVAYSSDNDAVATVNNEGLITAVGSGTATIKVKAEKDGITVEDTFSVTVTDVSADNIKALVEHFADEGAFVEDDIARSLQIHLISVNRFEKQKSAKKVVKHVKGFNMLLDHQKENELISDEAY